MNTSRSRRGTTLIELLIVLVVIGTTAGIAGLAWGHWLGTDEPVDTALGTISAARRQAVAAGRPVTVTVDMNGARASVTAMPDGTVLGGATFGIERLTGRPIHDD